MATKTVQARVATTHRVAKYDGWRLSEAALEQLAERLRSGKIPMLFNHDVSQEMRSTVMSAEVVATEDGEFALDVEFEVDAEDWASVEDQFGALGVPGGFSFTASAPQASPASGHLPVVSLAADAAAWSDEDRSEAAAFIDSVVPTATLRLFQYGLVEAATVVLVVAQQVGFGVLGNAVYDALKHLIRRRGPADTRIEIHRELPDGSVVKAVVTTNDSSVAKAALDTLPAQQPSPVVTYDRNKRLWLDR